MSEKGQAVAVARNIQMIADELRGEGCAEEAISLRDAAEYLTRLQQSNAALVEALKFYADPAAYTDAIPDFYSELDFADRAKSALAQLGQRTSEDQK